MEPCENAANMHIAAFPHGAPCWLDIAATGRVAAARFYSDLFGWEVMESTMPDGHVYSVLGSAGKRLGIAYQLKPEQKAAGVTPHWEIYFRVDDCDTAAAKAVESGGTILAGPMEISTLGRMASIRDLEGAVFSIWQPRSHQGAQVWREPDAPTWVELAARDTAKAAAFYASFLGWNVAEQVHPQAGIYRRFSVAGSDWGGLIQMNDQWGDMPSHWSVYFQASDVDATAARVKELGGSWFVPPFDAPPVGRIAMRADPQGAGFYIIRLTA